MGISFFFFFFGYLGNNSSLPTITVLLTVRRKYIRMLGDEEGLITSCDDQFYVSS